MSCSNLLVRNIAIKYQYHAKISLEYLKQRSELVGNHCPMLLKRAEKIQCFASMHCTNVYNLIYFNSRVFYELFCFFVPSFCEQGILQAPRGISFPPCLPIKNFLFVQFREDKSMAYNNSILRNTTINPLPIKHVNKIL